MTNQNITSFTTAYIADLKKSLKELGFNWNPATETITHRTPGMIELLERYDYMTRTALSCMKFMLLDVITPNFDHRLNKETAPVSLFNSLGYLKQVVSAHEESIAAQAAKNIFPINHGKLTECEINFLNLVNKEYLVSDFKTKASKALFYQVYTETIGTVIQILGRYGIEHHYEMYPETLELLKSICLFEHGLEGLARKHAQAVMKGKPFSLRELFLAHIEDAAPFSDFSRKFLKDLAAEKWPEVEFISAKWKAFEKADIFKQWASGEFDYTRPIFSSPEEVSRFLGTSAYLFGSKFQEPADKYSLAEQNEGLASEALGKLAERIIEHEAPLWAKEKEKTRRLEEDQAENDARRAAEEIVRAKNAEQQILREAEAAQRRDFEKKLLHEQFMASPQPYTVLPEAGKVWNEISHISSSTAKTNRNAEQLIGILEKTHGNLDIRGEKVKELGDLLFSAQNISATAKAFDCLNSPQLGGGPSNESAARISMLCASSAAVVEIVDKLLKSDDGIILLAALTRGKERCKKYADFLIESKRALAKVDAKIEKADSEIALFDAVDQPAFRAEPDYIKLLTEREKILATIDFEGTRKVLENEIRQALGGKSIKKIASAVVPVAFVAQKAGIVLPPKWIPILNGDFHPTLSPEGDKYMRICSNEFPYKYFDMNRDAAESTLRKFIAILHSECSHHRENLELLEQCKESNIAVSLSGTEMQQTIELVNAKAQFEERQFQQRAMLEDAQQAGIDVEGVDENFHAKGAITLKNSAFGSRTFATRGCLGAQDFADIQDLIHQVQQGKAPPDVGPLEDDTSAAVVTKSLNWPPKADETLMVFDANTLGKLSAKRADKDHAWRDETWLELIKYTARLPNVKVVIPAVVADWELQGKIPSYDDCEQRTGFERIDPRFQKNGHALRYQAEAVGKLLESASRAKIEKDGTVSFEAGENQNIIIMETEGDHELYKRIRDIVSDTTSDQIARFQDEIHKQDEGEKAITRIVNELPFQNPFMIVSDDKAYFSAADTPCTSGQGMPVGQASTGCYLDAEIRYREPLLRRRLSPPPKPKSKSSSYKMQEEEPKPLSLYRMGEEINAYWKQFRPEDYIYLHHHSKPGKYAETNHERPDNIYDIIRNGSQLSQAKQSRNNGDNAEHETNGSGNNWTQQNLKNTVDATPIGPEGVTASRRRGDGPRAL